MADSCPKARRADLLIEDVVDEVLVYDLRSHQAHCLNAAAAAVWRACDGRTPVDGLADVVGAATGLPWSPSVVRLALDQLQGHELLDAATAVIAEPMSRRAMIERVAVPAMMLPLVISLNVPTAAMAQSCPPIGPQGPQGITGLQGACECGPQGPSGPQFLTGQTQTSGTGPQGFQGVVGPPGNCGFQGPQGFLQFQGGGQGPGVPDECQGPQGLQGFQGLADVSGCSF